MDVIDRYLNAIRRNLPRDKAEDIVAELRDLLGSSVEEREAVLGRALSDEEVKAILKAFGHPLVVAARYRKQQWLIGPDIFPFYVSVLRIVLALVAAVLVVAAVAGILFSDRGPMPALLSVLGGWWVAVLVNVAMVTLIFAALERTGFPAEHLRRWDPAQLPKVEDKQPGPWESAIEVAFSAGFLLWWMGLIHIPFAGGHGFRIEPAPIFAQLYWPILVLAALRLGHNLIQWLRPRWSLVRTALAGLTVVGGLALLAFLSRAGHWAVIVPQGMDVARAAELEASVNLALRIAIVVAAVIWTFQALLGLYRRWRRGGGLRPVHA